MVDLPSLVQAAHGGDVVGNLARQFGLSPEQAQAAIEALTPAVALGLHNHIQSDEGAGQVIGALDDPTHQHAYADSAAAQAPQTSEAGANLLNQLFGAQGLQDIVGHVATETGVDANALNALAPVVASLVAGGVAKAMNEGGLASQAAAPAASAAPRPETLGIGYAVGDLINPVFNAMFRGLFKQTTQAAAPRTAPAPAAPQTTPDPASGIDLSALSALFKSSQASEALEAVLGQVFANRSHA
jgi:hypothetical protein